MYWLFPGEMHPCISAIHWARKRTWFVMCGGRSSILYYGPPSETNNLFAPTPNGNVRVRREINAKHPTPLTVINRSNV